MSVPVSPPHGMLRAMTTAAPPPAPAPLARLASDHRPAAVDPSVAAPVDRARVGRVADRPHPGVVRRALRGTIAPLLGEVHADRGRAVVSVWGAPETSVDEVAAARSATTAWAGLDDDPAGFAEACAAHPVTRRLYGELGDVVLPRAPSVGEAFARAVIGQLVQRVEAKRSVAQLVARTGTPATAGLTCWPSAARLQAEPPHALRRCGISLRGAKALHAGAIEDARLERAVAAGWGPAETRLRALPGVGVWTAAKTRALLGDPDAVPVGDYNLAATVGAALTGERRHRDAWTDAEMLELLAPFAGHRARVIRLVKIAAGRGLAPRQRRVAPRARLSAHRYW